MKKDKIKKLEEDIIGLKQINEQLELATSKAERFIEDNYPAINDIQIKQGWYSGSSNSTYRVTIDVYAEDLNKLITMFTHRKLREEKWSQIHSEIKEQIRNEIKKEYDIENAKT